MKIVLKRSDVAGKIPTTADLSLGELAINTTDGTLYTKKSVNGVESIVQVGATAGSGSSNPGTGNSSLNPNSPAMNSITPTGYGQAVTLPDGTTMSTAATNVFTIVNESSTYSLGIRDYAGTLRRVIPPLGQCNIGLKNKTTANDSWTYAMTTGEGGGLPTAETYLPSTAAPLSLQERFGNAIVGLTGVVNAANPSAAIRDVLTLYAADLTTGNIAPGVQTFPADSNVSSGLIKKFSETSGVIILQTAGRASIVYFTIAGTTITPGPVYTTAWTEVMGNSLMLGQCVPNGPSNFLLTYGWQGASNYQTYARYFTIAANGTITSGPAQSITQSTSSWSWATYRYTELVSSGLFFNTGYAQGGLNDGYSITIGTGSTVVVGPQVTMTVSASQQSQQGATTGNAPVRVPGTNKWLQFFLDSSTDSMSCQCWIFNGTTLSIGPKFTNSTMGQTVGIGNGNQWYNRPFAYSSNVILNCLVTYNTSTYDQISILSAVQVAPDGTPSLITTQTTEPVTSFSAQDIFTSSASTPHIVTKWKFNGTNFVIESATTYTPADLQWSNQNTSSTGIELRMCLPQIRVAQGLLYLNGSLSTTGQLPSEGGGQIIALQDNRIKTTMLQKTGGHRPNVGTDSKVGGFGSSRIFIGNETSKRGIFTAYEVIQSAAPVVVTGTVNKPSITSPTNGAVNRPDTFLITTSPFVTTGANDVHMLSDYQIWTGANGTGTKVWDNSGDTVNKVSVRVPLNTLTVNTKYYARVRQTGASLGASAWSDDVSFTTAASYAPTVPGTAYAGGFYAGRYKLGDDEYAIVVAPRAAEQWLAWGSTAINSLSDGAANTQAATGSPAANMAKAYAGGGFTDWYIGSAYENDLIWAVFKPMTGDQVNTGTNPIENKLYGWNPYTIPPTTATRTQFNPAQTVATAWRYGATGTAQTLPTQLGCSTVVAGPNNFAMETTTVNGNTSGTVFQQNVTVSATFRPIRRVKLT